MKTRTRFLCGIGLLALVCGSAQAWGAATVTFSAGPEGTYPGALKHDGARRVLQVDLARLPRDATIFRAELVLRRPEREEERPVEPTVVHLVDQPEAKLPWVAPRFMSLDALAAVRAAVQAGKPLELQVQRTAAGVARLEVSYLEGKAAAPLPTVTNLKVTHRRGQSLLVFTEPEIEKLPEFATGSEVGAFAKAFRARHAGMGFRIWRSSAPITPKTIAQAQVVGECDFFTGWNRGYHQDHTDRKPPVRYRVTDGGEPVAWGTGIYAHNPPQAGAAYYAVTVTRHGQEDLDGLTAANTTAQSLAETVGPGEPILQWKEEIPAGKEWLYRPGPLVRLIYTRWEAWPHSPLSSRPIDYLVALPARKVEPAPVGLHLHCWGGSLNDGYGWWYNGGAGAVLIASNQVPYDWWMGHHESRGTAKTFADGVVRPFTSDRMFAFLDWAGRQWQEAPEPVRPLWRKLDLGRAFAAGASMGGSGAGMYGVRFGSRLAWTIGWVGVHIPEQSPTFASSYRNSYGARHAAITVPDGRTSPWDFYSDDWWLRQNPKTETALIIASNGKNDGGIGWPQAVKFAKALQETRRPHYFNWLVNGHNSRTRIGADLPLDVRVDQSLPAFTRCTLDDDIGTGTPRPPAAIAADKARQEEEKRAGKRQEVAVDPMDGDTVGQFNAYLRWQTDDLIDTSQAWELTAVLLADAPKDRCQVDLTPRRLQQFRTPKGARFAYRVTDLQTGGELVRGGAVADEHDLLTLPQIPLIKGKTRVRITPAPAR